MLELKSQNYVLEDRCRRQEIEMSKERQRLETLEKEVNKYQNLAKLNPLAFAKSFQLNKNKDKEQREKETVDQLQLENEHLQYKIQLQEDEFRLTNETLREEIVRLVKHNETLNLQLRLPNETNDPKESADRVDSTMSNIQNKIKEIELIQRPDTLGSNSQLSYAVLKEKEQLESRLSEMSGKLTQMEETNRQLIEDAKELIQSKTEKIALEQEFENLKRHNHEIDKARTEQNETFQKLEVKL